MGGSPPPVCESEAELQVVVLVYFAGAGELAAVACGSEAVLGLNDDFLIVHDLERMLGAFLLALLASGAAFHVSAQLRSDVVQDGESALSEIGDVTLDHAVDLGVALGLGELLDPCHGVVLVVHLHGHALVAEGELLGVDLLEDLVSGEHDVVGPDPVGDVLEGV